MFYSFKRIKKILFSIFFLFMLSFHSMAFSETNSSEEVTDYLIKEVNRYRSSYGLSPVKTSKETCDFAKIRAKEIALNFSHDKFNQRYKEGKLPYSSWREVNENIAMSSDYKKVVDMWIHSPGHAKNMRANTPYVCIKQYGDYYAYLGMRPK